MTIHKCQGQIFLLVLFITVYSFSQCILRYSNICLRGIALAVHKKFLSWPVLVDCSSKILVVKLQECFNVVVVCIYRPPTKHICSFSEDLLSILMSGHDIPICVVGDFNEDILLADDCYCNKKLK